MTQLRILLATFFFSFFSTAQLTVTSNGYFFNDIEWHIESLTGQRIGMNFDGKKELTPIDVMSHQIQFMKIESINKKGKTTVRTIEFNRKGRVIAIRGEKEEVKVTYMNDTTPIKMIQRLGKSEKVIENEFDGQRLTKSIHLINGKPQRESKLTYNSMDKIETFDQAFGRNLNKSTRMIYSYDEANQKLKRSEFFINGKLKRIWNYDCSEEGELVEQSNSKESVEQASSCDWREEANDGSYIVYYRYIYDGKVTLGKHFYTKDSVVYRREAYNDKNNMTWLYEVNDRMSITSLFKNKGKMYQQTVKLYSPDKVLEKKLLLNNRSRITNSYNEYSTNDFGFIARQSYTRNGKKKRESTYTYQKFK